MSTTGPVRVAATELRVTLTVGDDGFSRTVLIRSPGEAPASAAVQLLLDVLRERGHAELGADRYALRCERLDLVLDPDKTLIAQGVEDDDVLRLVPAPRPAFRSWPPSPADEGRPVEITGASTAVEPPSSKATRTSDADAIAGRQARWATFIIILILLVGAVAVIAVATGEHDDRPEKAEAAKPLQPSIAPGRYVQLASFRGRSGAKRYAAQLRAHHLRAHVIASDGVANLYPAWQVVAVGPVASAKTQRRIVRRAAKAGFSGGLARRYTPAVHRMSPERMAGSYVGHFKQKGPRSPSLTKTIKASVTLRADGTGTIEYEDLACSGTLAAAGRAGVVVVWKETIGTGACTNGGRWTTKIHKKRLVMTWRRSGHRYWVTGRLKRDRA